MAGWLEEKAEEYCNKFSAGDLRPQHAVAAELWTFAAEESEWAEDRFGCVLAAVHRQAILWERRRAEKAAADEGETPPEVTPATDADVIRAIVREEIRKTFTAWAKAARIFGEEIGP